MTTCIASSAVGTNMRLNGAFFTSSVISLLRIGKRKPNITIVTRSHQPFHYYLHNVFPLPVSALTIALCPCSTTGKACIITTGKACIITTGKACIITTGKACIITTGKACIITTGKTCIITTGTG